VIENAKDIITKEKASKFKSQRQKHQLNAAIETQEHRGCTRAISSIVSWKEGFVEDIRMYKKRERHDKYTEPTNNDEEQFATQFFNFMWKHPDIIISHVSIPKLNLDIDTRFTPSNVGSAPDNQKDHVNAIKDPTPCTLLYVNGRKLRTTEVLDTIVMYGHIMHGWPISSKYAVVEVTTIKEGHRFEDLDYPDENKGIEKLKDAKGNFILWPYKDIHVKIDSSSIVSPQNKEGDGTPTSHNTSLSTIGCHLSPQHYSSQNIPPSQNPPPTQPLRQHSSLCPPFPKSPPQNTPRSPQNPLPAQPLQHHSPQHPPSSKSLP
jgi:hypothetical protein